MQEKVKILGKDIPVIIIEKELWYPISYFYSNLLNKEVSKGSKAKYEVKKLQIDFAEFGVGGMQLCNCVNEETLKGMLNRIRKNKLSDKQKENLFNIKKYFNMIEDGINLIFDKENYKEYIKKYNIFIQNAIEDVVNKDIKWKRCISCNNWYPLHTNFYFKNTHNKTNDFNNKCNNCCKNNKIRTNNKFMNSIYYNDGLERYKEISYDKLRLYYECLKNEVVRLPIILRTKEIYLDIIHDLYDSGKINKDNITIDKLKEFKIKEVGNLKYNKNIITLDEIYESLFGKDFKYYSWKYKGYRNRCLSMSDCFIIFNNYIKENKIIIDDIFNFDYYKIIEECGIVSYYGNDLLGFVVELNNKKYAGYKFKISSVNYYKNKENRIFDMKWLIEKDLKLDINKIPLYITRNLLHGKYKSLYNILYKRTYYKNLFEWINECYPNKFIELDFDIGFIRKEFGSVEEEQIHEILYNQFKGNIIYNPINNERTIKILGKYTPDWFLMRDNKTYIVEYFGLYVGNNSKRTKDYIKRTNKKIKEYEKLTNYGKIYLFPKDIENNFEGVKNKIRDL